MFGVPCSSLIAVHLLTPPPETLRENSIGQWPGVNTSLVDGAQMATDINAAFREFLSEKVNLDPSVTRQARSSRDWLLNQIHAFPTKYADFPTLYSEKDIHFGSFARRTKIRELDDIDLIVGISALGTTYLDHGGTVTLSVPDGIALRALCFEDSNLLNSRRVINKFVWQLSDIPQYQKAEVKRTGEAAVLNLSSYTWSFDIVPGFFTVPEWDGRTFYLIPDGNGHWKKTDPRKDRDRVIVLAQGRGGAMLNALRLVKYWNERPTKPGMSSYLVECIVLNYYDSHSAGDWPDMEFLNILNYMQFAVLTDVQDPKGIQGNINNLTWEERSRVSSRAVEDAESARNGRNAESAGDHKAAIGWWAKVLGPAFPSFG
jgi:hypothetical protein